MFTELKEEELKPHLVAKDSTPYQRCTLVERTENESILNLKKWDKKSATHPSRSTILEALEDWPMAIQFEIFKPQIV